MRCLWLMLSTILALPIAAWGQAPAFPVKDINTQPYAQSSYPRDFITVGAITFFIAEATAELWKTDGTPEGTSRLAAVPYPSALIAGIGGKLFFTGGSADGRALWISDGTAAGTMPIKEVPLESFEVCNFGSAVVGERLYFVTCPYETGTYTTYTLWSSDGTAAGTLPLTVLGNTYNGAPLPDYTDVDGMLFFVKADEATGVELWKSNGSAEGTVLVKDIAPAAESSYPQLIGALDGTLIFSVFDGRSWGLWRSDGTSAGTVRFGDVEAWDAGTLVVDGALYFGGAGVERGNYRFGLWKTDGTSAGTMQLKAGVAPSGLTDVAGTVFFLADAAALWKSDGTPEGTAFVADVAPSTDGWVEMAAHTDDMLFFYVHGTREELWVSDGTAVGTVFLAELLPPGSTGLGWSASFAVASNYLFFTVGHARPLDNLPDVRLWKSDGSASGTLQVMDLDPEDLYHWSTDFIDLGSGDAAVVFAANSREHGVEPWTSDGTPEGTRQLVNIQPDTGTQSAAPIILGAIGSTLLFSADDGIHGRELWRSDGTEAGTVLVRDIDRGQGSGLNYASAAMLNDVLYFGAFEPDSGWGVWRSDGSTPGTMLLKDLCPGICEDHFAWLAAAGTSMFFSTVHSSEPSWKLWKSDGTAAGTVVVADRLVPTLPTAFGADLFFANSTELWKSDGTAAGTVRVAHLGAYLMSLKVVDDVLFIVASRSIYGEDGQYEGSQVEVWKSNGTAAGTVLVKSTPASQPFIGAGHLEAASGRLYFVMFTFQWRWPVPVSLWSSDGTPDGTAELMELGPAYRSAVVGDTLYFSTFTDDPGSERLYRVHGTAATVVKQVFADNMREVGGRLMFSACDPPRGCEVWDSDGTPAGTRLVADVNVGPPSSGPYGFTLADPFVFFAASTGSSNDNELWAMPFADLGQCGDGSLDPGEICDTAGESATCDADCTPSECGDAAVNASAGEVCDDGGALICCSATCTPLPRGTSCLNGDLCDGSETCDGAGTCRPGSALVCDDGDDRTTDWCDYATGCQSRPIPTCIGDCNDDRVVSVDELVAMVDRAMGRFPVRECLAADGDQDGRVRIEEIVAAVANSLRGCPG